MFRFLWLLLALAQANAAVSLASPFTDHAVLQRDLPVPVWGTANQGETVTVTCQGISATAVAGADGTWKAVLAPLPTGGPYELTITGSSTIVLKDVLVGEVWLCSGQSNMEFPLNKALNGADEVTAANYPRLRLFLVERAATEQPQSNCKGSWSACTPQSAAAFSAVGYFFGRAIQNELNVPVGLISASWGGTMAEAWTRRSAMEAAPEFRDLTATMQKAAEAKPANAKPQNQPGWLYNGMIAPVIPYGLRGAIWYQGEGNAQSGRGEAYRRLLPLMISDWRAAFGHDLSFYLVQLANFGKEPDTSTPWPLNQWALVREGQSQTAATLPHCGLAVAIDIGNPDNIHPTNKQEVGRRLALNALAKDYGKAVMWSGPVFKAMTLDGTTAVLSFDYAEGLAAKNGALQGFTLAGEDGRFFPATAEVHGTEVHVTSAQVAKPAAVRYGWANSPVCNLVNGAGLPASPFRFPLK